MDSPPPPPSLPPASPLPLPTWQPDPSPAVLPWPDLLAGAAAATRRLIAAHSRHFLALSSLLLLPLSLLLSLPAPFLPPEYHEYIVTASDGICAYRSLSLCLLFALGSKNEDDDPDGVLVYTVDKMFVSYSGM
uniref:Uncharacterized protein n=1 Tax=Oryza barthii TaxID=65489 RepID=A0A0D3HSZ4_9ORYZ